MIELMEFTGIKWVQKSTRPALRPHTQPNSWHRPTEMHSGTNERCFASLLFGAKVSIRLSVRSYGLVQTKKKKQKEFQKYLSNDRMSFLETFNLIYCNLSCSEPDTVILVTHYCDWYALTLSLTDINHVTSDPCW